MMMLMLNLANFDDLNRSQEMYVSYDRADCMRSSSFLPSFPIPIISIQFLHTPSEKNLSLSLSRRVLGLSLLPPSMAAVQTSTSLPL